MFCPACKLWNTGHGANMMREAVSLMGGYGVTEDCPGFLGQKWMDAQLEATYEGPEAVQRLQLSITITNELFLAQFDQWTEDCAASPPSRPGTGACTLATAMKLWRWTLNHLRTASDAHGAKLYHKSRQSVTFPLADALCWLLAARQFILDIIELEDKGMANPALAEGLPGFVNFFTDLCHVQCARAAGEVGPHLRRTGLWLQPPSCLGGGRPPGLLFRRGTHNPSRASSPASTAPPAPAPMSSNPATPNPAKAGPCVDSPAWRPLCGCASNSTAASPAPASPKTAPPAP